MTRDEAFDAAMASLRRFYPTDGLDGHTPARERVRKSRERKRRGVIQSRSK